MSFRTKGLCTSFKEKIVLSLSLFIIVVCLGATFANVWICTAQAVDNTGQSGDALEVSVVNINNEGGATSSLCDSVYFEGDALYLTWKGSMIDNDFVIPTNIKYGSDNVSIYNAESLLSPNQLQVENERYKVRVG